MLSLNTICPSPLLARRYCCAIYRRTSERYTWHNTMTLRSVSASFSDGLNSISIFVSIYYVRLFPRASGQQIWHKAHANISTSMITWLSFWLHLIRDTHTDSHSHNTKCGKKWIRWRQYDEYGDLRSIRFSPFFRVFHGFLSLTLSREFIRCICRLNN